LKKINQKERKEKNKEEKKGKEGKEEGKKRKENRSFLTVCAYMMDQFPAYVRYPSS
jgi:hypothetical protein